MSHACRMHAACMPGKACASPGDAHAMVSRIGVFRFCMRRLLLWIEPQKRKNKLERGSHMKLSGIYCNLLNTAGAWFPARGDVTDTVCGTDLHALWLMDNNAELLSGRSMTAPTCTGLGRTKSTLGVGTSVVDHILRVCRGATGTLALPPGIRLDHTAQGAVLEVLASDHCPVMFFCGPRTRAATVRRSPRVTWRLELLHQQQVRDSYQIAVRARAHTALDLWRRSRATNKGLIG